MARKVTAPVSVETHAIKGFNTNLTCRDFQFEIGKTYEITGPIKACEFGFHACEYPIDVFSYYPPGESRYAEVRQSGEISRDSSDSKIASAKITIDAEIHIPQIVDRAIKWLIAQCKPAEAKHAEGHQSAASSTGDQSAASSTGDRSAAMSSGIEGRAQGVKGNALFLVYRDPPIYNIKHAWAGIVGQDDIKPMTWYQLGSDGNPLEVVP